VILYLDTSAFVKIYIDEAHTKAMRAVAKDAEILASSIIAYAEMRSALARRTRAGDLSMNDLVRIKLQFEQDCKEMEALQLDDRTVRRSGELAETYSLRGFDAVHLAAAESLRDIFGTITFACFDAELSRAASASGMSLLPAL
jgi:uncharacterized protein